MDKAIIVFSGGIDSVCTALILKPKYELYGISFSYGQRAKREITVAKDFTERLEFKQHKIVDISFMKDLYGNANVLTGGGGEDNEMPKEFKHSIIVPIRNAIFLSIASAWAYVIGASLVGYGAHTGDSNYPDCRPEFAKKIESAFNQGEIDRIKSGLHKEIKIWSPYRQGYSKSELLKTGINILGDSIFKTWSCYLNDSVHCGVCESCNNRKNAFEDAGIKDMTEYHS